MGFFKAIAKNWKTSATGALTLALVGVKAASDPTILLQPDTITAVLAGVGLLLAKDASNKPAPVEPPK